MLTLQVTNSVIAVEIENGYNHICFGMDFRLSLTDGQLLKLQEEINECVEVENIKKA